MIPDKRLTRLEETVTYQASMIDDLSEIVRAQTERIEKLERRVAQLRNRAASAESEHGNLIGDERPPHY